jgi:hypothetical protein
MREIPFEEAKQLYTEIAGTSGRYNLGAARRVFAMGIVLRQDGTPYKKAGSFANSMNYLGKLKHKRRLERKESKENKDSTGV